MKFRLLVFYIIYSGILFVCFPLVMAYFLYRSRKDPRYRENFSERFGFGESPAGCVLIHTASIGEFRGSFPFIQKLLDRKQKLVISCLTPVARSYARTKLSHEIEAGLVVVRYLPLEYFMAFRNFFSKNKPKLVLICELETWPIFIASCYYRKIPVYLINSQITHEAMQRVGIITRLFGHPVELVSGVAAKSSEHAANFRSMGQRNVVPVGEFRFDQLIPQSHIKSGKAALSLINRRKRPVIGFSSIIFGEADIYINSMKSLKEFSEEKSIVKPLYVFVPRAPEVFDDLFKKISESGLSVIRRSEGFSEDLQPNASIDWNNIDVLLGDSFGEMYFYLKLCDNVVAGGGFWHTGAHNIIEQLQLHKPVTVGPEIWTIKFPAQQAEEAGLLTVVKDPSELKSNLRLMVESNVNDRFSRDKFAKFLKIYAGASNRALAMLDNKGLL